MQDIVFPLFHFHNLILAACEPNPCLNGGSCQLDVDNPDGFVCKCPPKVSGSKCESKIYSLFIFALICPEKLCLKLIRYFVLTYFFPTQLTKKLNHRALQVRMNITRMSQFKLSKRCVPMKKTLSVSF